MQHSQPVTNNNGSVYYSPTSPNLTPGAPVPLNNAVPFNPGANAVGSELTPSPLSPNQLPLPASNSMPTLMFQPNGTAGPTSTQNDGTQQQISFRQQSMVQQAPLTRQPFQQYRNGPQTIAAGASMPSGFPVPANSVQATVDETSWAGRMRTRMTGIRNAFRSPAGQQNNFAHSQNPGFEVSPATPPTWSQQQGHHPQPTIYGQPNVVEPKPSIWNRIRNVWN